MLHPLKAPALTGATVGTLDKSQKTISNIAAEKTADQVKAGVTPDRDCILKVYDTEGREAAGGSPVQSNFKLHLVDKTVDTLKTIYTLQVAAAAASTQNK